MRSPLIVDDFYSTPDYVRSAALSLEYTRVGNFPGLRSPPFLLPGLRETFEVLVGESITNWPTERDNGAFQWTQRAARTAVHADPGWVALVYLTPRAPASSGTLFYRHRATGSMRAPADTGLRQACEREGQDPSKWQQVDSVENIFNRLVLFEGSLWHSAADYFGETLETARIFQTFFFWTENSADW